MPSLEVEYEKILTETTEAVLFLVEDEEVWIPKSQMEEEIEDLDREGGEFTIPEWLAVEKGLD